MKYWVVLLIVIAAVAAGWLLHSITFNESPITDAAHRQFDQHLRKMISTAESMPANRYGYAPPDSDRYFLGIAEQAVSDAEDRCTQLLNLKVPHVPMPPRPEGFSAPVAMPEEFKKSAVGLLKSAMDLCDQTFPHLNDSKLNELTTIERDQKVTKAEVLMDMLGEVTKAENEMEICLQLNRTASVASSR